MGESTPTADPPPPAALQPAPSRRRRFAWYAGAVLATAVVLAAGLRLDRVSLREPLEYDSDALLIQPMVKATVEGGTHWTIPRMGFPGVYELYDFPVVDHLHLGIIWLMGRVTSDWVLVFNLYHLLTWPLTTLTAMWAFRRLGLSLPFAAAGGMLYAFQPYHYYRGEAHYFLAAYWLVPLSWLPALAICKGEFPFFVRRPDGGYDLVWKTRAAALQVVLAAATASAGAYYAFFACAIYAAAGAYGWVAHRTWKAGAAAATLAGLVAAFGLVNHAPAAAHAWTHGRSSATERMAWESERYGMKAAQLVLPVDGHSLTAFRRVRAAYVGTFPHNNENGFSTLGLVGSAGLVGLLGALFFPARVGWPYRPAAALALFIFLFASAGGFGAVFNLLVFDQIRCLNRFSIYLAFLCLLAVLWLLDSRLAGAGPRVRAGVAAGLVALGVADQSPGAWFSGDVVEQLEPAAARFRADRRFFARVEEAVPGGRVLCLPYMPFPEVPPAHDLRTYEHARVYLHSDTLVSGYGAIKYREADEWLKSASFERDPGNKLRRVVARGFDGVLIDGRGYLTQADANRVIQEFKAQAPAGKRFPEVIHDDGRQVFLDLRPYREWLRQTDPGQLARWEAEERDWVALCFLRGFTTGVPYWEESRHRWAYRTAVLQVVNPTDRERTVVFAATFDTDHEGEFGVRVAAPATVTWADRPGGAGPWDDAFTVGAPAGQPGERRPVRRRYTLVIPPGRTTVRLECTPPPRFIPGDTRPICYFLTDITFTEAR
jgi:hypothetical protein